MKLNSIIKLVLLVVLTCLILIISGCAGRSNYEDNSDYYSEEEGYEDGTYCAEIDYYYSETGTSSTYTLEVEIENNELTMIYWPNGGWLDDSHFSPPDISDGEASFTSDRYVDYTVRIIGVEGDCSLDTYVTDEDELIQEKELQEERIRQEEEDRISQEEEDEEEEEERRRQEEEENDDDQIFF